MLTISSSFGDPWIVGTHTRNRAKIDERRNTIAQNIRRCIIPIKRAHKTYQTDQPSPGTDHLTSEPTRQCTRERRWPEAAIGVRPTPHGRDSGWVLAGTSFLSYRRRLSMFPYLLRAGTDLWSYKRGLHTLSQGIPIHHSIHLLEK
jgi:hypothetical protein